MFRSAITLRCLFFLLIILGAWPQVEWGSQLEARTGRYRATWRQDPATSMVIGFEHIGQGKPTIHYGTEDHGRHHDRYPLTAKVGRSEVYHGMHNRFFRLDRLQPATLYYFVIRDQDGNSQRMYFETPPDRDDFPLSIVAGGDSRNNREVARRANKLAGRLKPHFIMFGGDMTHSDTPDEWQMWLDDWQLTIAPDGRITPVLPARGNHERRDETIYKIFDVARPEAYYALTFGGDNLRTYTLNSMVAPGGNQQAWLRDDLRRNRTRWKIAQYHHAMRPHTLQKPERDELIHFWGTLFDQFGVNLVIESDAHVVKQTYPIRPSKSAGAVQGFVRDDDNGTVYVGEGCWGAPLRPADDPKPWSRASGSFNQFKWIWVGQNSIKVRTVVVDRSYPDTEGVNLATRFVTPSGFYYWDADNGGDVLTVYPRSGRAASVVSSTSAVPQPPIMVSSDRPQRLIPDARGMVTVPFQLLDGGKPTILVAAGRGGDLRILRRFDFPPRGPGPYREPIALPSLPPGEPVEIVVKTETGVVVKYPL